LYYNDFEDLVVSVVAPVPVTVSATGELGIPANAGAATSQGMELEFGAYLTDNLKLSGNVAYTDFSVDEVISLVGGVPTNIAADFPVQDLTPEWQGFLGLEYTTETSVGELRWFSNLSYRDEISVGPGLRQSPIDFENSESFTNWSAGLSLKTGTGWRIDFSGNNLLDERRPVNVINGGGLFGAITWFNEPRTWSLTAEYSF
jgi:iron complex outermembrane receptor protein